MTTMNRRAILAGLATLPAIAAPIAAAAAPDPDSELLARFGEFEAAYAEHCKLRERMIALNDAAEADPLCPPSALPASDPEAFHRWAAFKDARGCSTAWDAMNEAGVRMGAAANAVMEMSPQTLRGLLAKFQVARLAVDGFDEDLACYQEDVPWIDIALGDLRQLVAGGQA